MTEQDKKKQREIEEDARIEYHHTMPIQFRFTDADRFGHVNNSVYLQYYDTAKVDYFEKVGADIFHRDHAMVIAHIEFNFLGQVYTTDDVEVQTAITHIGRRSMKLSQRLIDRKTGEVKCEASASWWPTIWRKVSLRRYGRSGSKHATSMRDAS